DSARRNGGVSSWLADVRIVTPCPLGGRGPMTRVVLWVGPVLVSTVVPFWVDIHTMTTGRVTVGQIKGTVKNQSGYPVANATVLLDGRQAKTTIHGEFAFEEISPGMYWISIKPPNDHLYNDVRQVPLNAGETRLLDIVLDFKIPSTSDRYTYYLLNNTDMYLKLEFPEGVEIWADDNDDGWFEPDEIIRIIATP